MLDKCNYKRFFLSDGKFYKANLSCHTNISDGEYTPEEIKELYKSHGYSVVAFSDSDVMIPHRELKDDDFLPLTACEYIIEGENGKSCHFNAIALDESRDTQPLWHREKYVHDYALPYRDRVKFDESLPDYEREFSPEKISEMMQKCRDEGFFVTYNHPRKSGANYTEYTEYRGMDAIEIMNYSSIIEGVNEYNDNIYEDILKADKHLPYCVAADENKNFFPAGSRECDSLGAYTMINAKSLDYESIAEALKSGRFYSTEGPEIYDLWYRSEVLYIRCSPCDKIIFESAAFRKVVYAENGALLDGKGIYFWVMPEHKYVRVTIVDKEGKRAYTNAYPAKDVFYTYEKVGDMK